MRTLFIIITIGLLFIQCDSHNEYSDMIHVDGFWKKKDTLHFDFTIKNSQSKKNINFVVRNNNDYPFSNLYVFVKLSQGKNTISIDTLNYQMADNTGKWLGSGMGSVKEIYLQYKKEFKFPKNGEYNLSVVQGMRKDTLQGIEDLGINIE